MIKIVSLRYDGSHIAQLIRSQLIPGDYLVLLVLLLNCIESQVFLRWSLACSLWTNLGIWVVITIDVDGAPKIVLYCIQIIVGAASIALLLYALQVDVLTLNLSLDALVIGRIPLDGCEASNVSVIRAISVTADNLTYGLVGSLNVLAWVVRLIPLSILVCWLWRWAVCIHRPVDALALYSWRREGRLSCLIIILDLNISWRLDLTFLTAIMNYRAALSNLFFFRLCISVYDVDRLEWMICHFLSHDLLGKCICLVELSSWILLVVDVRVPLHFYQALIWSRSTYARILVPYHYRMREIIRDHVIWLVLKRILLVAVA